MDPIYMTLVIAIVMIVAAITIMLLWDYRQEIRDIRAVRGHARKREALLLDYYLQNNQTVTGSEQMMFTCDRRWVDRLDTESIFMQGYYATEKWMTDFRYIGIPIYVRLHNFHVHPAPNEMMSSALFDYYNSNALKSFVAGLTKINFAPIDLKSLAVIIPVVIGLCLGLVYFLM